MWFDLRGEGSKSCRIWVESCRFKVCFLVGSGSLGFGGGHPSLDPLESVSKRLDS